MPEESRTRRLAILIDADNTSPRIAAGLFEEVAKFGEASVRRIYGDFSGQRLKSWADILQKYAIDPYQQFAYTRLPRVSVRRAASSFTLRTCYPRPRLRLPMRGLPPKPCNRLARPFPS